jgi:signal transduction histidine kinase
MRAWIAAHREAELKLLQGDAVLVNAPDGDGRGAEASLIPVLGTSGLEAVLEVRAPAAKQHVPWPEIREWCRRSGVVLSSLRENQARQQGFSAGLHTLVTPLAAARGFTKMLLENQAGALNGVQREYLSTILENVEKMVQTVGGLRGTADA